MTESPLRVLYLDDHFIAVDKPSGLFVHKNAIEPKAPHALSFVRDMTGGIVWPVHRLDRPTSGVLVFGRSRESTRRLSQEFREKRVTKTYHAVVRGHTPEHGTIDYPLARDKGITPKSAVSSYKRLATVELPYAVGPYNTARYSFVEVKPETGRHHQIRRHFAHVFHPLVGDRVYGDGKHNRFIRDHFMVGRLLLSATSLSFTHPFTGETLCIECSIQADMAGAVRSMFGELFV